jgi:hypothetical protein
VVRKRGLLFLEQKVGGDWFFAGQEEDSEWGENLLTERARSLWRRGASGVRIYRVRSEIVLEHER